MKIILDTNILVSDYSLEGPAFRTLMTGLSPAGVTLYIPRIVLDEVTNKYREEFEKTSSAMRRLGLALPRFPNAEGDLVTPEEARDRYSELLRKRFENVGVVILDYPVTSHEALVSRALARRKPFRGADTGGYRDALIWESVLALAKSTPEDTIAFVTANSGEFADESDREKLHQHLEADLAEIAGAHSDVTLFKDLSSFVDSHIKPTLEMLEGVRAQLVAGTYPTFNLHALIQNEVPAVVAGKEFDPAEVGFPDSFESPSIASVEEVYEIRDVDVRKLPNDELLLSFAAEVEAEFDVFLFKSEYYGFSDSQAPFIWNSDWNDHYMAGSAPSRVELTVTCTVNAVSGKLTSAQVNGISPRVEWWQRGEY